MEVLLKQYPKEKTGDVFNFPQKQFRGGEKSWDF